MKGWKVWQRANVESSSCCFTGDKFILVYTNPDPNRAPEQDTSASPKLSKTRAPNQIDVNITDLTYHHCNIKEKF